MMKGESSFFNHPNLLFKGLAFFGAICVVLIVSLLFWASNKGFELSDESFYTIGYYFNIEMDNPVILFHRIYNVFFGWFNLSLAGNRLLASALVIGSSLFLAKEVETTAEVKHKLLYYFFIVVMSGLYHTIFPMAVSYNILSVVFINGIMASVLAYFNRGKWISIVLVGFFISLLIFNKFTNAVVALFFIVGAAVLFFEKIKQRNLVIGIVLLTLGLLIGTLFTFGGVESFLSSYEELKKGLALSTEHSLSAMVIKFYNDSIAILSETVNLIPFFLLLFLLKRYKTHFENYIVALGVVVTYVFLIFKFRFFIGNYQIALFYYLTFVVVFALLVYYQQLKKNRSVLLFAMLLIAVPFVSSLGTNNSLYLQFLFYGGAFGVGLFLWIDQLKNPYVKQVVLLFVFVIATVQITYKKIKSPYRMKSLNNQTEEVIGVPYLNKIQVDSETAELIQETVMLQEHPSDYIFLFSEQLGLSILTNKKPLLFTWLNESKYHLVPQLLIEKKELLQENILFVLPKSTDKKGKVITELSKVNEIDFHNKYEMFSTLSIKGEEFELYAKK